MKILITGGTGFIGSHLIESLSTRKYNLRCLVRKTSNLDPIKHLSLEYIYGDMFSPDALRDAVKGVDYVYHVAGTTKAKTKEEYYWGNQLATKNILEAVLVHNPSLKRFIHVSSQAAVGPSPVDKPINETTPFHPLTTYGRSKMEAEKECLRLLDKLPITIVRPPAVYGPRDKDVFEFFNTMNKGLQPMIGLQEKYVSLIHVKSLVEGIILAGEHPRAVGQTYFISSERYYGWKEIGDITARVMNKSVIRLKIPHAFIYIIGAFAEAGSWFSKKPALLNLEKVQDIIQNSWTCDITKAKTELGYKELIPLEEGITQTVKWYRENGWLS